MDKLSIVCIQKITKRTKKTALSKKEPFFLKFKAKLLHHRDAVHLASAEGLRQVNAAAFHKTGGI